MNDYQSFQGNLECQKDDYVKTQKRHVLKEWDIIHSHRNKVHDGTISFLSHTYDDFLIDIVYSSDGSQLCW